MRALPLLLASCVLATPAVGQEGEKLSDAELAAITGKFVLPNGVALALSVTSDTVVDGQLILRTVFKVDDTARVSVLGRSSSAEATPYATPPTTDAAPMKPTGVEVAFDRRSGTQTITPTYASVAPTVTIGAGARPGDGDGHGLSVLPVAVGGPAVETPDGSVSLSALRNGTQVTLAGHQLNVSNLVGSAIATAIANTADNRTIDTVTNVDIDLRDAATLTAASAAIKIDTLVSDISRGMIR